jgi:uncharacterized membrane protein YfcA
VVHRLFIELSEVMLTLMLGICVGLVLGLTGAGGGILAIPALTLGLGWSVTQATPIALLAVGGAATLGALHGLHHGLVRYKAAVVMAVAGWCTAPVGLYLSAQLPGGLLMGLFGVVMFAVACRMYAKARQAADCTDGSATSKKNCMLDPATGRLHWTARSGATLAAIGASSGLLTGLLGVGGGFLIVPALRRVSNVPMHGIVATSLMVVALISLGALTHLFYQGFALSGVGMLFTGATFAGMVLGRLGAPHVSGQRLQRFFAVLCIAVSVLMVGRAVVGWV